MAGELEMQHGGVTTLEADGGVTTLAATITKVCGQMCGIYLLLQL